MPKIYEPTPDEQEIILAGVEDPNVLFDYWFRKPGAQRGFQLDFNFTEKGAWQKDYVMASQTFIVAIAGISTGKSLTAVMSAAYYSMYLTDFKFLNVAREGWQSQLMYQILLDFAKDTKFDELIIERPRRPYPKIVTAYKIGEAIITGTMEFMSVGESGDATNLFSWRGDIINIEEAGRIENLGEIVGNLSTRLTGGTSTSRPYMGRMSIISNAWDNDDLWQLFGMAEEDKEDGLVFNIDTEDNKNTTEKQVRLAIKLIDKDGLSDGDHERFMTGKRPKGLGGYFSAESIAKGENPVLSEMALEFVYEDDGNGFTRRTNKRRVKSDYIIEKSSVGIWHYRAPRKDGRLYFLVGDPGIGAAPARNAPAIMAFDVTDAPQFINLVGFWWGNGGGSIFPWINQLMSWMKYYKPIYVGVDSTSTQKNMAEIINVDYISGKKFSVAAITGMDFSGPRKDSYLVSLRLSLEADMLQWPDIITGISSQLGNYDRQKDKSTNSKLAQDLVATLSMGAFAVRAYYGLFDEEDGEESTELESSSERVVRNSRDGSSRRGSGRQAGSERSRQR